ncbi:MAG: ATP-binding protein, partial [Mycobacteriales bacterium]
FAVLEPEPVDVVELLRQARCAMSAMAERAGVQIVLAVPDSAVVCEIDPRRVARILRNLISNAVEYGRPTCSESDGALFVERSIVQVRVAADDQAVAVTVRDRGVGLYPQECDAVFHRFWRGDPSRARHTGGTGLGLSIALEDARLHGGWLQAWGRHGAGAQFRLTLPRHAGARLSGSPLPLEPGDTDFGGTDFRGTEGEGPELKDAVSDPTPSACLRTARASWAADV